MSRINANAAEIDTTQHQPVRASGTPLDAFSRTRNQQRDDGTNAAAKAIGKLRGSAGTEGEPKPKVKKKPGATPGREAEPAKKPARRIDRSERDDPSPDDSADTGEEDAEDEAEDGEDAEEAPARAPRRKGAEDDTRTKPNADYSKRAPVDEADDAEDAEDEDADADDSEEGEEDEADADGEPKAKAPKSVHESLVEQYTKQITGNAGTNGQQVPNGQNGQRPLDGQQPPNQQQQPQRGQQQQQDGGAGDSIFSDEEIKSLEDDGNETVAKVLKSFDQRLSSRIAGLEQLLGIVSTDAIERLQARKVRTSTEDNKFFGQADSPYRKVLKDPQSKAAVSRLATQMQRDQMSRAEQPMYLGRDEALAAAADVLFPGVRTSAARHQGRKDVEGVIKKRHARLSIASSGGQRGGGGNGRGSDTDSAADAIGRFKRERGIA